MLYAETLLLMLSILIMISCEEDVVGGESSASGGEAGEVRTGLITEYFYDLDNESVNSLFLHYRKAEGGYSNTIADTTKIDITKTKKLPFADIIIYCVISDNI